MLDDSDIPVLDEAFVAAATRTELSAEQRHAAAAWRRRSDAVEQLGARPRRRRLRRFAMVLVAVAAVGGIGVALQQHGAATSGPSTRPAVAVDDRGVGAPTDGDHGFTRMRSSEEPVGYDPCRTIEVEANFVGAPPAARGIVVDVLDEVAELSGLDIEYVGETERDPAAEESSRGWTGWPPVLIAWSSADRIAGLAGDVAGQGGSRAATDSRGELYYVTGSAVIDVDLAQRFTEPEQFEQATRHVLRHEIGHVLGLGHVTSASQVMAESGNVAGFGRGDRKGLEALGAIPCAAGRL